MRVQFVLILSTVLSGCGAIVPKLTYNNSDQLFVRDVHKSIRCELISSVKEAAKQAEVLGILGDKTAEFFKEWGVRYSLTLSVVSSTTINPSLNIASPSTPASLLSPGSSVFTLNAGANVTVAATGTDVDTSFNTVDVLLKDDSCPNNLPNNKLVLFGNNLGFVGWMNTRLSLVHDNTIASITASESFSATRRFDITRSASLTPRWTFIQRTFGNVGGVFSTNRNTSHSVLVTFGPADKVRKQLARDAAATHRAIFEGLVGSD